MLFVLDLLVLCGALFAVCSYLDMRLLVSDNQDKRLLAASNLTMIFLQIFLACVKVLLDTRTKI